MAEDVGKHFRQTPIEPTRQTLVKRNNWVQSRQTSTGSSRQTLAQKKRWEPVQTDTDQTHQTDTSKKDIVLIQRDIKRSIQTDPAKDVGKHFRQTPIEITRKILARQHLGSVQTDINELFKKTLTEKERQK